MMARYRWKSMIPALGWLVISLVGISPLGAQSAPTLSLAPHNEGMRIPSLFDATLSHTTPAYVSLDVPRSVTLLYSSGQAAPTGLVQVDATDASATPPEKMSISLRDAAGRPVRFTNGSTENFYAAGPGTTRLAAQWDAGALPTGAYSYTVVVRSWWGTRYEQGSAPIRVLIVNERGSPFGAGWWLAGLDRLLLDPWGRPGLWVGGDGSTRRYLRVPGTPERWAAEAVDRPDTLVREADGTFTRLLPGGVRVRFDASGQHVATVNRLGHTTGFAYDARGRLERITLPVPEGGGGRRYRFAYGAGSRLASADAPAADSISRTTPLAPNGAELTVTDPDTESVVYTYAPGSGRITARRDRRETLTRYAYEAGRLPCADPAPHEPAGGSDA